MGIGPDATVFWSRGFVHLNATIVFTWVLMAILTLLSIRVGRGLRTGVDSAAPGRLQLLLETVVETMRDQIREASQEDPEPYLGFVGSLFLFVAGASVLSIVPGYVPPTASLSTTAALAVCVFVAVPIFGVLRRGLREYLADYLRPTPFMLPFHLVGEFSRTLALAVRLFGNIASGQLVVAIIVSIVPLLFPVALNAFGLLIGIVQAYVFAMLALVYIVSAVRSHHPGGAGGDGGAATSGPVEGVARDLEPLLPPTER